MIYIYVLNPKDNTCIIEFLLASLKFGGTSLKGGGKDLT